MDRLSDNKRISNKIVHFCFGMTSDFGGRPFGLSHYLAVRSAWEILSPDIIIMHCLYEPSGVWWDLARPYLKIHHVHPMNGIYGFPVDHPAHKADIIRLAALIAMGGVYADTDVLFIKPFDDLPKAPFTAAMESTSKGIPVGLSNAVLIAESDSHFARLCLEGHDPARSLWNGFRSRGRDEHYVEFSVRYPCLLAQLSPGILQVLPSSTFLHASWDEVGLGMLFDDSVTLPTEALAVHLWESHSWEKYLSKISAEEIARKETTFNNLARPFLPDSSSYREVSILPEGCLDDGFATMDRICKEIDFIKSEHIQARSMAGRISKSFRKIAKIIRNEMNLPLRVPLERIEEKLKEIEWSHGVPLTPNRRSSKETNTLLLPSRMGLGDGSDHLLNGVLKQLSQNTPITYLIATGEGREVAAAEYLSLNSELSGVWISDSLHRADELRKWTLQTGRQCIALYGGTTIQEWAATMHSMGGFYPTVLLLAGTGREYWQWKAMQSYRSKVVIVSCNPAFDPQSTVIVPAEPISNECGINWGASMGAFCQLGLERGYSLYKTSPDGFFLLFILQEDSEPETGKSSLSIYPEFTAIRTSYGDQVRIKRSEAETYTKKYFISPAL